MGAARTPVPAANKLATHLKECLEEAKVTLQMRKEKTTKETTDLEFKVGDKVWLSTQHISTQRPTKKLDWRCLGLYPVTRKISKLAYELELPKSMQIHNVFHASLLSRFVPNQLEGQKFEEPLAIVMEEGKEEYKVEEIVDLQYFRNQLQDFVKWKGYVPLENKWEPWFNIENVQGKVAKFHKKLPEAVSKANKPHRHLQAWS